MTLFLRSDVHAVAIGEDLALLDLQADAYLCVAGGGETLLPSGRGQVRPSPVSDMLAEASLVGGAPSGIRRNPPPPPNRTIIHTPLSPRLQMRDLFAAVGAISDIRRARRGHGLSPYVDASSRRTLSRDRMRVTQAARLFWDFGAWLPIEGECLVRSALLMAFLRRQGLTADWVFGVRLWPFAAHCWVQIGDVCLNDDIERLWPYTPIYCR